MARTPPRREDRAEPRRKSLGIRPSATGAGDAKAAQPRADLDLQSFERQLREIQAALTARTTELAKPAEPGAGLHFGKRIGDGTTEAISRLTDIGVGRALEANLEEVEAALAKLDNGTYGICESCGEPIPPKRLQARPESVLCVDCSRTARR